MKVRVTVEFLVEVPDWTDHQNITTEFCGGDTLPVEFVVGREVVADEYVEYATTNVERVDDCGCVY